MADRFAQMSAALSNAAQHDQSWERLFTSTRTFKILKLLYAKSEETGTTNEVVREESERTLIALLSAYREYLGQDDDDSDGDSSEGDSSEGSLSDMTDIDEEEDEEEEEEEVDIPMRACSSKPNK